VSKPSLVFPFGAAHAGKESCRNVKEIVIFNGSPRMDGNTSTLLNSIAKGARDNGAEVHFYTLFKMKFMACQSCFACRAKEDCVIQDELNQALQKVKTADAVVIGSPIYMMQMTGPVKNLYDRLLPLMDAQARPRFGSSERMRPARHLRSAGRVSIMALRGEGEAK
jgi:multimeric flavodoxin WrbA